MIVAIVLYPGLTALDALGPYELLKFLPNADVRFVASKRGLIPNDRGVLQINATHTFDEVEKADIVLVPGSEANTVVAAANRQLTEWLRRVDKTSWFTVSVCSGAVVLAAAGLLAGKPATTHWAAMDALKRFGAIPQPASRVVRSGKVWTAAGVSAGIDLALALIKELEGREAAECAQLMIEYDPQPPCDAGHMDKASAPVIASARKKMSELSRNPINAIAISKLMYRTILRPKRGLSKPTTG